MKKTAGVILALSIMLNSGIAAFSAVVPDACVMPAVTAADSQMAKLFSSVFDPLRAMDRQVRNDNPLTPNMTASPKPGCLPCDVCSTKNIITTTDNRSSSIRQDFGTAQNDLLPGFSPACFARPRIFPPPGSITCVNGLYLEYFVFLAKSNLPWEIGLARRV